MIIKNITAREILDSRGFPTVEVDLVLAESKSSTTTVLGRAAVPSGASTGEFEALELRDGDKKRFLGKGVQSALKNITQKIAPAVMQREFPRQTQLDDALLQLDGTKNKSALGANAILAVSMAFARAQAHAKSKPTFESLAEVMGSKGRTLPVPLMNVINGGKHADNTLEIQEFMIVPVGFETFRESLRAGVEIFHFLKNILKKKGASTSVGDEGGFAPTFDGDFPHTQALECLMQAISDAGYRAGKDVYLALDVASSEMVDHTLTHDSEIIYSFEGKKLTSNDLISQYQKWITEFPILSIEDGLSEHDWTGWSKFTQTCGSQCQLVGDDLFVTNPTFLKRGIQEKVANSILIKLNQIGTVTETLETMKLAQQSGYTFITSHRSGETEDTFIAELAVGTDCGQIKTGSASRTDRVAKYNQLLRIEERLADRSKFAGKSAFKSLS